jgi:hypothetical protein
MPAKLSATDDKPRPRMNEGEIAAAAIGLACLQAEADKVDWCVVFDLMLIEMLAMRTGAAPESLATLLRMLELAVPSRGAELAYAALRDRPPTPLSDLLLPIRAQ